MRFSVKYRKNIENIGIQSVCSIYGSFAHLVYSSVVSRSLIMTESNVVNRFRVPKSGEDESKLLKECLQINLWCSFSYLHFMPCINLDI